MNIDETDYSNDTKFRSFVSQVDKCLKGFEYSSEWADLITNLGRLIKLLQSNAKFPVIPKKQLVGKRLSQCLHPALPAGVHMKALECLDVIFKNIGPRRLADDLFIYCNGIFPLLSPSAMHIKKPLFDLYENHFIPLNIAIRPAFVGLLQGLLPGLEEGAEFYQRGNVILEKFTVSVEPVYFYTCLWQVMLQAPSVRVFGTAFLLNHYNRHQSTDDQLYYFGNSISLMLTSLTHILNDQQVLVQRQALDFVLYALNMHCSQLTVADREMLCAACLAVLLRRDMSLNRRFYNWLMGSNLDRSNLIKYVVAKENLNEKDLSILSDTELHLRYFKKYSRSVLIASINWIIAHPLHAPGERLPSIKPFRIITTLMDRSEIGGDIIEDVLFNLIVYLEKEYFVLERQSSEAIKYTNFHSNDTRDLSSRDSSKSKTNLQEEFLKTANLFFTNLESSFFWNYLNKLFITAINHEVIPSQFQNFEMTICRICELVKFILIRLPIETYSEVHTKHLPVLLASLTDLLAEHVPNLGLHNIKMIIQIYRMIFEKISQNSIVSVDIGSMHNPSGQTPCSSKPSSLTNNVASQNSCKIMSQSIHRFREFTRKFFLIVLGCNNDQITQCANSLFCENAKKIRTPQLRKVSIAYNSLNLSMSVDSMVINVYHDICQLLVEMTSYPLLAGPSNTENNKDETICTIDGHQLPYWIICLITSACFMNNFSIKSIAMSTLLDLIYATRLAQGFEAQSMASKLFNIKRHIISKGRSLSTENDNTDLCAATTAAAVNQEPISNPNIILPLLSDIVINELDNNTDFFTIAGLSLWDYLSTSYPQCHQVTVDLINRLHKTAPKASICEDLILQKLLTDNLEECLDSHRRFILMWQLLAKQEAALASDQQHLFLHGNVRTFDKCVLVLLDSLDHSSDSNNGLDALRTLCQGWLEQAFQDGHSHKIISPLLLALLKPDTARISLPNLINLSATRQSKDSLRNDINIDNENSVIESDEKRIYAISNVNGNIQYHLKPKSMENMTNDNDNANKPPSIYLIQSLDVSKNPKSKAITNSVKSESSLDSHLLTDPSVNKLKRYPIHLHINPLDQSQISSANANKWHFEDQNKDEIDFRITDEESDSDSDEEMPLSFEPYFINQSGEQKKYETLESENSFQKLSFISSSMEPNVKESMGEIITNVVSTKDGSDNWDNHSYLDDDVDGMISNQFMTNYAELSEEISDSTVQEPAHVENGYISHSNCLIHPLHNHLLVYCSIYDSNSVLYSLSRLRIIMRALPGIVIPVLEYLISISPESNDSPKQKQFHQHKILEILSRHSNALKGINFYQNPTIEEMMSFKNYNHLEIIMLLCTWFMCSYYPVTDTGLKVSADDIFGNKKVQILASEILDFIIQEMLTILQVGYVNHRGDFVTQPKTKVEITNIFKTSFDRCNVARFALHCMSTSITRPEGVASVLSDSVISLNECDLDQRVRDTAQITLMRLVLNVLKLDYGLNPGFVLSNSIKLNDTGSTRSLTLRSPIKEIKLPLPEVMKDLFSSHYVSSNPYIAVSRQSILLTSIVACIGAVKLRYLHSYCYQFVISSLGVWGRSTSTVLMPIVKKLTKNIRLTAQLYESCTRIVLTKQSNDKDESHMLPLDYSLTTLSCLKAICHFLLLDEALKSYQLQEEKCSSSEQSFLEALFNKSKDNLSKEDAMSPGKHIVDARNNMIKLMSRIIDSLLILWEKASLSETDNNSKDNIPPSWTMGRPEKIRQIILSIIKPLLQQHPTIILISLAKVWPHLDQFTMTDGSFSQSDLIQDICLNEASTSCSAIGKLSQEQYRVICILEMARGWKKSFTIVQIINTCRDILRKPFPNNITSSSPVKNLSEKEEGQVKVNLLEFLQCFLITESASKLSTIAVSLFGLLKESITLLPPTAAFILLKILSDFISKVPIQDDKREQRDIQDLCQKVLENVAIIAGSSLEQPSWFRRAAQLKLDSDVDNSTKTASEINTDPVTSPVNEVQSDPNDTNSIMQSTELLPVNRFAPASIEFRGSKNSLATLNPNNDSSYKMVTINARCTPSSKTLTLQAINLLTTHLASIIDVIYRSEEKEKVLPFLNNVIFPNVLPYLRYRNVGNILNFRIASQLMASLSSYQHTRRSWRKDVFDLLFESYFFQFDVISLKAWKAIIDNLMTQDKSTFKEAYTKLTVAQGGGLNIFSSKEAEYDQTATCLKKIAFIIYSSELDQYVKSMPEIQEKLSDSLRLGIIPQIQTQIFLCFRVLLMRISHQHMTSLWHIFIPTLTAVLQSFVEDLQCETKSTRYNEISRRLPMYLSACKLLDIILLMKEESVPQFLYYKWAFVGNLDEQNSNYSKGNLAVYNDIRPTFQPFLTLIIHSYLEYCISTDIPSSSIKIQQSDLFTEKPIIYRHSIQSLMDLATFFFTASLRNDLNRDVRALQYGITVINDKDMEYDMNTTVSDRFFSFEKEVELLLDHEFVEPLNRT